MAHGAGEGYGIVTMGGPTQRLACLCPKDKRGVGFPLKKKEIRREGRGKREGERVSTTWWSSGASLTDPPIFVSLLLLLYTYATVSLLLSYFSIYKEIIGTYVFLSILKKLTFAAFSHPDLLVIYNFISILFVSAYNLYHSSFRCFAIPSKFSPNNML